MYQYDTLNPNFYRCFELPTLVPGNPLLKIEVLVRSDPNPDPDPDPNPNPNTNPTPNPDPNPDPNQVWDKDRKGAQLIGATEIDLENRIFSQEENLRAHT